MLKNGVAGYGDMQHIIKLPSELYNIKRIKTHFNERHVHAACGTAILPGAIILQTINGRTNHSFHLTQTHDITFLRHISCNVGGPG